MLLATVIVHRDPKASSFDLILPAGAWVFPSAGTPGVTLREFALDALGIWMLADGVADYTLKLAQSDRAGESTLRFLHVQAAPVAPVWVAKGGDA